MNSDGFRVIVLRGVASALSVLLGAGVGLGQSSMRSWGKMCTDSEARGGRFVSVDATAYTSGVVREDGRIICYGVNYPFGNAETFPLPPGLRYLKVAMARDASFGLLSDGSVVSIGSLDRSGQPPAIPALPSGRRYVDITAGAAHALFLLSDRSVVGVGDNSVGQLTMPQLPNGVYPIEVKAGAAHNLIRLSDGAVIAFGRNTSGQCNVPPLPVGQSYVSIDAFAENSAAIRSDGTLLVWGDNSGGQCNVPPGSYQIAAVGMGHTVAWRSDGVFVGFGDNTHGQLDFPPVPPGVACKELACGVVHSIALMTDGSVLSWGDDTYEQSTIPSIPIDPKENSRMRMVSVAAGGPYNGCVLADGSVRLWGHRFLTGVQLPFPNAKMKRIELGWGTAVALSNDGQLLAWGDGTAGRTSVPALPNGVVYVDFDTSASHTAAIRSDGEVVRFGSFGVPTLPALPPGQRYVQVDAESRSTALLRSDGTLIVAGAGGGGGATNVPPAGAGLRYTSVAHCDTFVGAIRSDGTLAVWGSVGSPTNPVWRGLPPLPTGVVYVEISGGNDCIAARRSDGQVVAGGWTSLYREHVVPPLLPGTSYVEVDGGDGTVAARVGPTSTYVSFYQGCAGSRPAARLIPTDTPRIGNTLDVRLFDLPVDFAFVALGFTRTSPIALDFAGMPGCEAHLTVDQITFAAGQGGVATVSVPIPDRRALIGARFYQQAFVLDPAAGNAGGAVVSAAAEAVVGDW